MVDPSSIAYGIVAGVFLAFGAWLFYLSPRHRATRALAALLACMSVGWGGGAVSALLPPENLQRLLPLVGTAQMGVGIWTLEFLCVYPRPRGWVGRSGAWVAPTVWLLLAAAMFARPELYAEAAILNGEVEVIASGPLVVADWMWAIMTTVMLVALAVDATRTPPGALRSALLLVLAGFLTSAFVYSLIHLLNDVTGRLSPTAITEISRIDYIRTETAILGPAVATAIVVFHGWRSQLAPVRRDAMRFALFVGACTALVLVATFAFPPPGPEAWLNAGQVAVDALGGLAIAAFPGYALLKHRLFDIDVKLRWTISRGTIAGVFLAIFFVAAQLAQNFLSESYGWMVGGAIAGIMLFAIAPIQRIAERVALAAVPTTPGRSSPDERRREVYRIALSVALADKVITREEERHLARLAEELGIGHTDALSLRESVEREMGLTT